MIPCYFRHTYISFFSLYNKNSCVYKCSFLHTYDGIPVVHLSKGMRYVMRDAVSVINNACYFLYVVNMRALTIIHVYIKLVSVFFSFQYNKRVEIYGIGELHLVFLLKCGSSNVFCKIFIDFNIKRKDFNISIILFKSI